MTKKIAIQGYYGSFHEMAAKQYFGEDVEVIPFMSFHELFDSVKNNNADFGLVAIENSLVGSILNNYQLLKDSGLIVSGEHKLRIKHNLLALPGQKIEDIKEVHSHPMAILQCQEFFKKHPHIRLINSEDTALRAYEISKQKLINQGAISNQAAAERFGMEILESGIETNKRNFTRFLLVGKRTAIKDFSKVNKASWVLTLKHERGSLAKLLNLLLDYNLNLTKIQSLPIVGQEWKYLFYIDVAFDNNDSYRQALLDLRREIEELVILGEYCEAQTPIAKEVNPN